MEVDTIEAAKRMVERGLGISFLPQMAVGRELHRGKLSTVKIVDAEPLRRSLDLIHPRHRPLRAQAQAFLRIVREEFQHAVEFAGHPVRRGRAAK